jgi:hypothetical protein
MKGCGSGNKKAKWDARLKWTSPFTYVRLKRDEHLHDVSPFIYNIWDAPAWREKRETSLCLGCLRLLADMRHAQKKGVSIYGLKISIQYHLYSVESDLNNIAVLKWCKARGWEQSPSPSLHPQIHFFSSEKPSGQYLSLIVMSHWRAVVWIWIWDILIILHLSVHMENRVYLFRGV